LPAIPQLQDTLTSFPPVYFKPLHCLLYISWLKFKGLKRQVLVFYFICPLFIQSVFLINVKWFYQKKDLK